MKTKISNIGSIVTWSESANKVVNQNDLEILVVDDRIVEISSQLDIEVDIEISAENAVLTPGFIDCHTHPVFFGNRSKEYVDRLGGKAYNLIAKEGGGILSTVEAVREVDSDTLYEISEKRINNFLKYGTTTIEAKSGYGLDLENEIKILNIIKDLNAASELEIVPTFLGAHSIPNEYKKNSMAYVDILCEEMLPEIAQRNLAIFCDVFCEKGYFSYEMSKRILSKAKELGLKTRLHADEFVDSQGSTLAAEVGCLSADHLMQASESGLKKMADKDVVATLLPGTTFFLGKNEFADYKKIKSYGIDVAMATDYNPGTCTLQSLPFIMNLGMMNYKMDINEAFISITVNAAKSLGMEKDIGVIEKGYQADLLFWDIDSLEEIPYWISENKIIGIMKKGKVIRNLSLIEN